MKINDINDLRYAKELNIWEMGNHEHSSLILLRIDENTFQVVQNGQFQPLITNTTCILIDKKYTELLSHLSEQVILKDVTIIHRSQNTQHHNYLELSILNKITPDFKEQILENEMEIWEYSNSPFISKRLKNEFLKIDENDFDFLAGFPLIVE